MLRITDKYYLSINKTSFTLYERSLSQTTGKETYKSVGYFNSLEGLYVSLVNKEIRDNLELLNNIDKISAMIQELKDFTVKYVTENKA